MDNILSLNESASRASAQDTSLISQKLSRFWFMRARYWQRLIDFRRGKYSTPLGLSRKALLAIYCYVLLTCSCTYYGWQFYAQLFESSGVYGWLCKSESDLEIYTMDDKGLCDAQRQHIQALFTYGVSSQFICAIFCGFLVDYCGQRVTGCIGTSVFAISMIMLGVSSESLQLYIPAMLILGGITDCFAFAAMRVNRMYPGRSGLVSGIIVSAMQGSWYIPAIWYQIHEFFPHLEVRAIFFFHGIIFGAMGTTIFFFTMTKEPMYLELSDIEPSVKKWGFLELICFKKKSTHGSDVCVADGAQAEVISSPSVDYFHDQKKIELLVLQRDSELEVPNTTRRRSDEIQNHRPRTFSNFKAGNLNEMTVCRDTSIEDGRLESAKSLKRRLRVFFSSLLGWKSLKRLIIMLWSSKVMSSCLTFPFISFTLYNMWTSMRTIFFNNSIEQVFGYKFKTLLGLVAPMALFAAIAAGWIIDRFGGYALVILNILISSLMLLSSSLEIAIQHKTVLAWISIVLFCMQNWNHTMLLTFMNALFAKDIFGTLVGITSAIGGFFSLLSSPLYTFGLYSLKGNFFPIYVGMTIINILYLPCFVYVWYIESKSPQVWNQLFQPSNSGENYTQE